MKKLPRSPCLQCGRPCKRATTKCCSQQCNIKWQRAHGQRMGGPPNHATERTCPTCQKIFLPNNHKLKQKFCSYRCSGLARAEQTRQLGHAGKGRQYSQEIKNRMSPAASNRAASTVYTKGKGGFRKDIQMYVRSSWEANVVRILQQFQIQFAYEPTVFTLIRLDGSQLHYRPDIQINDTYIEIKGWWDERSLERKSLMASQYPDVRIHYIDEPIYLFLQKELSPLIKGWE